MLEITFKNAEDAQKIDAMRIGVMAAANDAGTVVRVEPYDEVDLPAYKEGVWAGLAAAGVFAEVKVVT